jgi:chromosome segregation ATPase
MHKEDSTVSKSALGLPISERPQVDTSNTDESMESRVEALLQRKAAVGHKLTPKESIALTEARLNSANFKSSTVPKVETKLTLKHEDNGDSDIGSLDSLLSDDTDDAVIEGRQAVQTSKATEGLQIDTSSLRASLLSKAKEMVDTYKLVLENDGFTGPEGEATRHFLTELGSELTLNLGDSRDITNLKAELISKNNEIVQLQNCVASKDEIISDMKAKDLSFRTNVSLLEDELDTVKMREKRLEAKISSMDLLQDSIYKENTELKKWKDGAEVTLTTQSHDLDQLIEQNSTLLDLCSQKEAFIKDLSQWKSEAEGKFKNETAQLNELSAQASHLLDLCGEQQSSIKELTQWKSDAELTMKTQSADLKQLMSNNSTLSNTCKEQQVIIDELSTWKTDAKERLKCNEGELSKLRSDNTILLTKCNDQQLIMEKQQEDIKALSHKLEVESFAVSRFEEDFLEHSKTMVTLKDSVKNKTDEIEKLTALIDELTAQAKNAPQTEKENIEKERLALKMNHHKELSYLKTQTMDLTAKVEHLLAEQDEFKSQIEALSGNAALLEGELKTERRKHKETKLAVEGMEKALRVSIIMLLRNIFLPRSSI